LKRGFSADLSELRGTTLTARCNVVLRPVQADFRELPAHPATTSEFKQFEFFDLTSPCNEVVSLSGPVESYRHSRCASADAALGGLNNLGWRFARMEAGVRFLRGGCGDRQYSESAVSLCSPTLDEAVFSCEPPRCLSRGAYVVCLDCGKQFAYDLTEMKIGRSIDRSHEAAVVPSNLPMPRKKKLKYAFWAAVRWR